MLYHKKYIVLGMLYMLMSCSQLQSAAAHTMTQSEAHMSVPVIRNMVESWYKYSKVPEYQKLYKNVVEKERAYNDTHYVFYNAFSNEWRVPQDLYLKLYASLHPLTIDIKDFRAFRWLPVNHQTPKELLKKELLEFGMINDNIWRVKANLLSTNLALFGNVGFPGECTFEYFLNAKSNTKVSAEIFESILDIFMKPFPSPDGPRSTLYKYIPQLQNLDKYLVSKKISNGKEPQTLAQIFIPKEMVDQVAYLAWVQGIPHEEKLINWVMHNTAPKFGKATSFTKLEPHLASIRELFKDKQTEHPIFKIILQGIEEGKYAISTFLDQYKANPSLLPEAGNNAQARISIDPQHVGCIGCGAAVYDYDFISQKNKDAYEKELNEIVYKIRADVLKDANSQAPKNAPLTQQAQEAKKFKDLGSALSSLSADRTKKQRVHGKKNPRKH